MNRGTLPKEYDACARCKTTIHDKHATVLPLPDGRRVCTDEGWCTARVARKPSNLEGVDIDHNAPSTGPNEPPRVLLLPEGGA